MKDYLPESMRRCPPGYARGELERAMEEGTILTARAVRCDETHDLIIDLGCAEGRIPRLEAAEGVADRADAGDRDFALRGAAGLRVCDGDYAGGRNCALAAEGAAAGNGSSSAGGRTRRHPACRGDGLYSLRCVLRCGVRGSSTARNAAALHFAATPRGRDAHAGAAHLCRDPDARPRAAARVSDAARAAWHMGGECRALLRRGRP